MSSLYLPFGLIATFGAIVLVIVAAQVSVVQRRRAVEVLEAQIGSTSTASTNVWGNELALPFWERIIRPFGGGVASLCCGWPQMLRWARKPVWSRVPSTDLGFISTIQSFSGAGRATARPRRETHNR